MANLLSKINIGGVSYELKDAYAREQIALILEDAAKHMDSTGIFADDKAVKEYVDAQVGAINKFDVAVVDVLPTPSADTMYILYLVPGKNQVAGEYLEYITIRSEVEGEYVYTMEQIGSTKVDLAGFVTDEELAEALKAYTKTADLGELAFKDEATGTVAGEVISGVKATGTGVTGVTLNDQADEKDITSAGKYTPVGSVAGTTVAAGDVNITITNADAAATLSKADYTPKGTVTVSLSQNEFNKITSTGTAAQFTEGQFTPASIETEAAEGNFATAGIVGEVNGEELVFTNAGIAAISATKITNFSGGSKAADTFIPNTPATMEAHTVGVNEPVFTGEVAEGLAVTGVTYQKHDSATATFTGKTSDISATFTGTEGDVSVAGKYTDTKYTANANTGAIELAVGDITVSAKDVTVQ